ncbi:MAG: sigma-70 family RNA polymerase sigma factor [bacterium]|nr:sigma-70 family RNA polymerase sigma factor [bacterium]
MNEPSPNHVTQLLQRLTEGEQEAMQELMPLVYDEMRRMARRYLRSERPDHTLETSALVHEAYLKLTDQSRVQWRNRAHFYGIAAQTMRRILVDHARSHGYQKRGGDAQKVSLDEALHFDAERAPDLVALDDALKRLAETDPQKSQLVELRFFGGLSHPEIAEVLGVSTSTVERQWRLARAWLYRALND